MIIGSHVCYSFFRDTIADGQFTVELGQLVDSVRLLYCRGRAPVLSWTVLAEALFSLGCCLVLRTDVWQIYY